MPSARVINAGIIVIFSKKGRRHDNRYLREIQMRSQTNYKWSEVNKQSQLIKEDVTVKKLTASKNTVNAFMQESSVHIFAIVKAASMADKMPTKNEAPLFLTTISKILKS